MRSVDGCALGGTGRCGDVPTGSTREISRTLRCDPFAATCGVPCVVDADCWAAGYPTHACDGTRAGDVFAPGNLPFGTSASTRRGFCVSPTCASSAP